MRKNYLTPATEDVILHGDVSLMNTPEVSGGGGFEEGGEFDAPVRHFAPKAGL